MDVCARAVQLVHVQATTLLDLNPNGELCDVRVTALDLRVPHILEHRHADQVGKETEAATTSWAGRSLMPGRTCYGVRIWRVCVAARVGICSPVRPQGPVTRPELRIVTHDAKEVVAGFHRLRSIRG